MFQLCRTNIPVLSYRCVRHCSTPTIAQTRYRYPSLDDVENLENYRPGGFHPVSIGDLFAGGRYKVLHKLGNGGSSTVWLAQDQHRREQLRSLVTLKVMSAEESSKDLAGKIAAKYTPQEVNKFSGSLNHPGKNLLVIMDHFLHQGPNGYHLCLISPFAGPSMAESPGRVSGSKRLRGDLARKVTKQLAAAVELLHSARVIHGDLTPSNVLCQVSDAAHKYDVYQTFGNPETEEVVTIDDSPPGPHAPSQIVAPIDFSRLSHSLLKEDIFLIDFGQSFFADRPPPDNIPATPLQYLSPEAFFDLKLSFASDVWALACTIFEIRAGSPLFDPFFSSGTVILKQVVETLGRFPDPRWSAWEERLVWFDEAGAPKPDDEEEEEETLLPAVQSSLHHKLSEIGEQDDAPHAYEGKMIEEVGTHLDEAEVNLLADLLEKMLRYNPQDRISMSEVVQHPWFAYNNDSGPCLH
ncbi:kinase-like protein [Rickenella mellea]|uniref:Kinase-like protein n=1 Tax=Rickenella mellea TaxID=50990 RepID=A0A4Y7Q674_9AGAM|nr:kinase-like protein [Rickenella mellea]